ncbi:Chemotaxis regulator - transmits chemoreceptor signals to flagelllar motor components CheY [Desulfovibrio sp. DV]|uniref:response regulator n=1 Tax=Desulfovibrio sp. DV TaxID=1844708 RepID=UPI00094B7DA7|nr:response regulator [Desulfovibrio sp. DV]OLN27100.1 Chemotaxis regulator - transmits chemoreceptor signals to flagelllar motor components CheY [Desulfovibrio sp. DV]
MSIPKHMAILVVDDQQPMRKTIAYILRQLGLKDIQFAEDGDAAWKHINNTRVDLVLLDWNMPRLSGLSLLERIRNSEAFAKLPVIMVTAEANTEHVLAAMQTGVTDYVVKPFSPNTLQKKLQDVCSHSPTLIKLAAG